jgi:hypothetical protein
MALDLPEAYSMSPESVRGFRTKTCAKSRTYSMSREPFFTRHAVSFFEHQANTKAAPEGAALDLNARQP